MVSRFKLLKRSIQSTMIWCQTAHLVIRLSPAHWHSLQVLEIILHLIECMISLKSCCIQVGAPSLEQSIEVDTFHEWARLYFDVEQMHLKIQNAVSVDRRADFIIQLA